MTLDMEIEELLRSAVVAVWSGFGEESAMIERCDCPSPVAEDRVVGTLGFVSDGLRGLFLTIVPPAVLAPFVPACGEVAEGLALADIAGEQANMMVGRLKASLLGRGVALSCGLPGTSIARLIRTEVRDPAAEPRWFSLELARGRVLFCLDLALAPEFAIPAAAVDGEGAIGSEGSMFFF